MGNIKSRGKRRKFGMGEKEDHSAEKAKGET